MWGNRLGWIISAAVGVLTIGLYASVIIKLNSETEPTALSTKAGALDALTLPTLPRQVFAPGNGSDDAYTQALAEFKANSADYDAYLRSGKLDTPQFKKLKAVDLILTGPGKGPVFARQPSAIVCYNPDQEENIKQAEDLGQVVLKIANQLAGKDKPRAQKYFTAAFNFGLAMFTERLTYQQYMAGMSMMKSAAAGMKPLDPSNAPALDAFRDETEKFIKTQEAIRGIFNPASEQAKRRNAGDVFNFARNGQERMWRIEAILMLGHYRWNAGSVGDQRTAKKLLAELAAKETDPTVQAAVKSAQELTLAGHRKSM